MKPFFIEIQNFWAWADKLGRHILFKHYFYKKLSLYNQIPNIFIWDLNLGFSHGVFVVRELGYPLQDKSFQKHCFLKNGKMSRWSLFNAFLMWAISIRKNFVRKTYSLFISKIVCKYMHWKTRIIKNIKQEQKVFLFLRLRKNTLS